MTSFTISFPSLVRKLASSRRPLATRVIRALVLLLFIGAIVSLAATAAGAPVKPQFVDINPDDPGTPPGCPAPCPSAGSGGRVHRLATSKAQANDIYAASELGGLFKSENGGFAWRHLDGHLPTRTWDVAVDPGGEIVYATSLYDGRVKSLAGIEVSGNGGETWTHPAMTPPLSCSEGRRSQPSAFGISIRPGSPNEVLAGTNCGLARTTDFGVSWEFIDPVPLTRGVQSVFDVVALPGGLTYACGQDGVMRSPNGRTGWQALPAPYDLEGPYRGYCSMAVHPDFPLAVFVVFSRTTYFDSIFDIRRSSYFASFDGGQTWRFLLHPDGIDPKFHKRVPMVAVNRRSYGLDVWLGAGNLFRMPCVNFPLFGLACPLTDTTAWKGTFTDGAGELFKAHGDTGDVLFDPHPVRDACPLMYSSDGGVFYNAKDEEPGCHDPAFVGVHPQGS